MLSTLLFVVVSAACQCPPGLICPHVPHAAPVPTYKGVPATQPPVSLNWHWTRRHNGTIGWEWGRKDNLGRVVSVPSMPDKPEPGADPTHKSTIVSANYGLAKDRIPTETREWAGGPAETPRLIRGDPAVKDRVHLTFIGDELTRKAARSALEANPSYRELAAAMGERLAVQDFAPTNPMVADIGLPAGGRPDVIIQDAAGTVTFRPKSPPDPARIVAEIRKADPNYRAEDDPDGAAPSAAWLDTVKADLEAYSGLGIVVVLMLVLMLMNSRGNT